MKKIAAILLFIAAIAQAQDSPMVEAAKSSGGPKKKKSTGKVITNEDVKKATGKLTELPGEKAEGPKGPGQPAKSTVEKHEEGKRSAALAAKTLATAEQKVTALERELAKVEQSYYESTDPDYRDMTIAKKFAETKARLETARKELAAVKPAAKTTQ